MKDPSGQLIEYKKNSIFTRPPHLAAENYFLGDHTMDFVGQKGYGMTCTCRRDHIPKELKPYLDHKKVTNSEQF
jgi:hypothetical protein